MAVLDRAEAVFPGDPEIQLAKGIALLRDGEVGGALACLRAYRTSPDLRTPSEFYYAYTVLAAGITGQFDYAIAVGREGLVHYPGSGPLLVNTGAVLEQRGELQAAGALYARAVGRSPVPAQAHKSLGDQAFNRGDKDQARVHYEKALKIDPRLGDDVYLKLGTLAFEGRDQDVARLLWRRALELNPDNQEVRSRLKGLEPAP